MSLKKDYKERVEEMGHHLRRFPRIIQPNNKLLDSVGEIKVHASPDVFYFFTGKVAR
jgi:hypothetical protein